MADGLITAKIKVTAILKDPVGIFEDTVPVKFPEGRSHAALYQYIGAVMSTGGFIRELDDKHLSVIPMARVLSFDTEIVDEVAPSSIITDGVGNLAAMQSALKVKR